jgi:hypothetical protein
MVTVLGTAMALETETETETETGMVTGMVTGMAMVMAMVMARAPTQAYRPGHHPTHRHTPSRPSRPASGLGSAPAWLEQFPPQLRSVRPRKNGPSKGPFVAHRR